VNPGVDYTIQAFPSQRKFYESTARFIGFSGPVGAGKTRALSYQALRLSAANPGCMGLIGAPTYPMLRDATIVTFLQIHGQAERLHLRIAPFIAPHHRHFSQLQLLRRFQPELTIDDFPSAADQQRKLEPTTLQSAPPFGKPTARFFRIAFR
jgi:hypothetical protein